MTEVIFEQYNFTTKRDGEQLYVWDIIRKKYILLTPEEKVRQTILHYLVYSQKMGSSLIAIERKLAPNNPHRFDIVLFDRSGNPLLLVECKAPRETINVDTLLQGGNYNAHLSAPFMWLSNGATNFVFTNNDFKVLENMPNFSAYL